MSCRALRPWSSIALSLSAGNRQSSIHESRTNDRERRRIHDVVTVPALRQQENEYHKWQQQEAGMMMLLSKFAAPGETVVDPFCGVRRHAKLTPWRH